MITLESLQKGQEATGEGSTSVEVETPGVKWLWREAEAWNHVAGPKFLKRDQQDIGEGTGSRLAKET